MFYSHNLLARKGPLGTVWCAAHLQNKLKKSNYITVNIPSTVEQIMNPQVPIALRMSGHLLLGVVRIYSKKIDYLQHDYNVLRIDISKVYSKPDINLPKSANHAEMESITIPEILDLDLMDIDDHVPFGTPDTHLRRHEDITLSENRDQIQIPSGYIMISFNEDALSTPSLSRNDTQSMGIASPILRTPMSGFQDPGPSHQIQFSNEEDINIPSTEVIRDAFNNHDYFHMSPLTLSDRAEPDPEIVNEILSQRNSPVPILDEILSERNSDEPIMDHETVVSDGIFVPPQQTPPRDSTHSEPVVNDNSDPLVLFEVAPTPPVEPPAQPAEQPAQLAEQPRAKRRRIKYDEATVLTNEFMKKSLDNPSRLLRKRKGAPCSSLDVWRVNNNRKKENYLFDPLITGMCDNLCEVFDDALMSTRAHLVQVEQEQQEEEEAHFDDMEIENQRENVGPSPDRMSFSSPPRMDEYTPAMTGNDVGSTSYPIQTTIGTGVGSTPDPTSSTGSFLSDMETPATFFQDHHGFDNSGALSDIPEVEDDDDAGELAFIEEDGGSPISLKGTPQSENTSGKQRSPLDIGSLQARTKQVAQYIKEKSTSSTTTPLTPQNAGSVSLNSILEGKKRKVCARMFYETLVLKSCDLVEVKQDEPYGDIVLKVTSKLAKHQFSN